MKLYYKASDRLVNVGDVVTNTHNGEKVMEVLYFREPTHGEGKVYTLVTTPEGTTFNQEYYVSVIGAEWRECPTDTNLAP